MFDSQPKKPARTHFTMCPSYLIISGYIIFSLLSFLICLRILSLLSYHIRKFLIFSCDISIILSSVRKFTRSAVLDSAFRKMEITTAFISQCIQRTITEQAVKIFRICSFMAWKIFTFFILKKLIIFAQNGFLQSKHNHSIIISEQQADRKKCEWHKNCISVGNDTFCPFYHYNIYIFLRTQV